MATNQVICDTDVIIDYWDVRSLRHATSKQIIDKQIDSTNVVICAITKMELVVGATNKLELSRINKNLLQFGIISIDNGTTQMAIQLLQKYNLSHGLMLADSFIAATALQHNFQLFTYNVKDYKFIGGLKLYRP